MNANSGPACWPWHYSELLLTYFLLKHPGWKSSQQLRLHRHRSFQLDFSNMLGFVMHPGNCKHHSGLQGRLTEGKWLPMMQPSLSFECQQQAWPGFLETSKLAATTGPASWPVFFYNPSKLAAFCLRILGCSFFHSRTHV